MIHIKIWGHEINISDDNYHIYSRQVCAFVNENSKEIVWRKHKINIQAFVIFPLLWFMFPFFITNI